MRLRHKPWAAELLAAHREIALELSDLDSLPPFSRLEIGSGRGEFLIAKAEAEPKVRFLGVEVNETAFAIACKKLVERESHPANVVFLHADIERVLPKISDGSVEEIYLNFNDPWPKRRHERRRLTHPTKLTEYLRILSSCGRLLFKSDNDLYYAASKEYLNEFGRFATVVCSDDYKADDPSDRQSEYERKFRDRGQPIHRIVATKGE